MRSFPVATRVVGASRPLQSLPVGADARASGSQPESDARGPKSRHVIPDAQALSGYSAEHAAFSRGLARVTALLPPVNRLKPSLTGGLSVVRPGDQSLIVGMPKQLSGKALPGKPHKRHLEAGGARELQRRQAIGIAGDEHNLVH